jgi:TP53 regulating kinase-like protein
VVVPQVRLLDLDKGILGMEKIEGWSVREVLGGGAEGDVEVEYFDEEAADGEDVPVIPAGQEEVEEDTEGRRALREMGVSSGGSYMGTTDVILNIAEDLMTAIGTALAKLHQIRIIHGDLTTSNMMVRPLPGQNPNYELVSELRTRDLELTPFRS